MQPPSEALAIGRHVEIGVADAGRTTWFASRVEDHDANPLLTLAWPTDAQRRRLPLDLGQSLEVATCSREAMYVASVVVQHLRSGDVPLVTVRVSGEWQRSQRRAAVRTRVAIRPRLANCVSADARRPLRLGLTNISATGVQVRSYDELRRGDVLELAFELIGLDGEIQLRARVRRVQRTSARGWDAGCEFEGVSERLAQRIVQFIFAEQRAQARARTMQP
jgi:c-di-GMP-binding flagellar brake protein YcgR